MWIEIDGTEMQMEVVIVIKVMTIELMVQDVIDYLIILEQLLQMLKHQIL